MQRRQRIKDNDCDTATFRDSIGLHQNSSVTSAKVQNDVNDRKETMILAKSDIYTSHAPEDKPFDSAQDVQSLANVIRRIKLLQPDEDNNIAAYKKSRAVVKTGSTSLRLNIPGIAESCKDFDTDDASIRQTTQSPVLSSKKLSDTATKVLRREGCGRSQFALGPNPDFQLDLQHADESARQSYDLTESGTLDAITFQIRRDGITWPNSDLKSSGFAANQTSPMPYNSKKHFVKLGVLGRGASGVVYKAIHLPSFLIVAVKIIPVYEQDKRHQLIAEIKTLYNNLGTLSSGSGIERSQTIVPCSELLCFYDAFMNPNEGNVSIIVEYMDGGSLQDIVSSGGCKSESVLANIAFRVLKGLAFLHARHQLHRDIKPSNLLINHHGEVKISDFGIVREMESSLAMAKTFVGTPTYMSPERIASEEYSYKSDVWSLGLSLMACALAKYPYASSNGYWELLHLIRNESPPQLPSHFSNTFRDFVAQCLQKDQSKRWSVKDLLQHPFLAGQCLDESVPDDEHGQASNVSYFDDRNRKSPERADKEHAEICEMAEKVASVYLKNAKKLFKRKELSIHDAAAWIENLPAMDEAKLARLADQIGACRQSVYDIFHEAMSDLLQTLEKL